MAGDWDDGGFGGGVGGGWSDTGAAGEPD